MINISPIHTDADYDATLNRINALMDAVYGTPEGDELDILTTLVEAYEREHFAMQSPDPVEAILFRMEQMGLNRKALEPFLGGRSRVSEVLNRKRSLSMSQIRKLHDGLKIPLENLVGATGRSY